MHSNPNILGGGYAALMCFIWLSVALEYQAGRNQTIVKIGNKQVQLNVVILRIVFLVLWFMAAFRGMDVTNDTSAYYRTYQNIASQGFAATSRLEKGYVAFNILLSRIFPNNLIGFRVLLLITATMEYLPLEKWIEKHSTTYGVCIVAFYFLENATFMSSIRQAIAIGLVLSALFILEKTKGYRKYLLYIFVIVVACTFHSTAIVALVFPLITKMRYTRIATVIIIFLTAIATITNFTSFAISAIGLGSGYVTTEIGNMANVSVVSLLFLALLFLQAFAKSEEDSSKDFAGLSENVIFKDSFYTYCIALSLSVTIMSLRAAGMSRLDMYFQTVGLPYISNVMSRIENPKVGFLIKVVFCVAVWAYSVAVLIYRPEWQHLWPYHFYWQE